MKTIGIMQPYFFPYIGYFQLINMVDEFILYDDVQFTKKGWFHRNRMLTNGKDEYFTLPLKKDSDFLDVNQRFLAEDFEVQKTKLLRKIEGNYKKSPFFEEFFPVVHDIFNYSNTNLFSYILNSIEILNRYLEITTPITTSSSLPKSIKNLRAQDKVIEINRVLGATVYINSSGGIELYNSGEFKKNGIDLKFYRSNYIKYPQYRNEFVPYLSILDMCMFNSKQHVQNYLNEFKLI